MASARRRIALGMVVALVGPVAVAAALYPARGDVGNENVVLALVVVVGIAAVIGGWRAGVVAAVVSAVSFDFFHTRPYLSFTIASWEDVWTTVLLLVVGVAVGILAAQRRWALATAAVAQDDLERVQRLAAMVVAGEPASEVIGAAQAELTDLLDLRDCHFEAGPVPAGRATLERFEESEALEGPALPDAEIDLPVLSRGRLVGRFVLLPHPGARLPVERRVMAVAIADQVGGVWSIGRAIPERSLRAPIRDRTEA